MLWNLEEIVTAYLPPTPIIRVDAWKLSEARISYRRRVESHREHKFKGFLDGYVFWLPHIFIECGKYIKLLLRSRFKHMRLRQRPTTISFKYHDDKGAIYVDLEQFISLQDPFVSIRFQH
jgi:hypothetical protein